MPSFLSRLRTRAASTSTPISTQLASPAVTSVTPPIRIQPTIHATPPTTSPPVVSPLNRRIRPDVNSLLATYSAEQETPAVLGLQPRSRRHSTDGSNPRLTRIRRAFELTTSLDEVSEPSHSREVSQGQTVDEPSRARRLIRHVSQMASPGEWSTFGRSRGYTSPKISDFGEPPPSPRAPTAGRSTPSARTTVSRRSSAKPPSSQSNESKHSSTQNPPTPLRSRSSRAHISATVAADLGFDSPRTFGYPSPEMRSFAPPSNSPPPPLPPLNHPSLRIRIGADTGPMSTIPSTIKYDTGALFEYPEQRTYPRRSPPSRHQPAFSSFPFSKARSRSKSSPSFSVLKAQHIFSASSSTQIPGTNNSKARHETPTTPSRSRIRTISGRRSSADWSSQQATENKYSWPAQVSREILQLSLGQMIDMDGKVTTNPANISDSAISGPEDKSSRGQSITFPNPDDQKFPPAFLPTISAHELPLLLGSPFLLQSTNNNLSGNNYLSQRKKSMPDHDEDMHEKAVDGAPPARKGKTISRPMEPDPSSSLSPQLPELSFTAATPETSPGRPPASEPMQPPSVSQGDSPTTPEKTPSESKGKRKAEEEAEGTPPDQKKDTQHATFAVPFNARQNRTSGSSSHAPSSYHRKRARLSPSTLNSPEEIRPESAQDREATHTSGSWPSRIHGRPPSRANSRATSNRSADKERHHQPRQSTSQTSIPISALVSPHAPSVTASSKFHMRDPRKPRRIQPTGWSLRLPSEGEPGTPIHAWCFFAGFVIFPVWWIASFLRTPKTRRVGGTDEEKAVTLDDPQVEFDAKSWRFRCRVMAGVSFVTYIPFIILISIFEAA